MLRHLIRWISTRPYRAGLGITSFSAATMLLTIGTPYIEAPCTSRDHRAPLRLRTLKCRARHLLRAYLCFFLLDQKHRHFDRASASAQRISTRPYRASLRDHFFFFAATMLPAIGSPYFEAPCISRDHRAPLRLRTLKCRARHLLRAFLCFLPLCSLPAFEWQELRALTFNVGSTACGHHRANRSLQADAPSDIRA